MFKKSTSIISAAVASAVLIILSAPGVHGAVGDVVNQFHANDYSWAGGGVAWRDGYLWEKTRGKSTLYKRDPVTGQTLDSIKIDDEYCTTMTWDPLRQTWWMTDPFDYTDWADVLQIPATGGGDIFKFEPGMFESGIYYDRELDRLWIGANIGSKIALYRTDGTRELDMNPGFSVQGLARAGDYLWAANWTDGGHNNYVFKLDLEGYYTGVSFQMPGDNQGNVLTFDGKYLWCLDDTGWIYQIDIGFTTPTPTPSPTPASLILDSGDYDGDSTSDVAIFRKSLGLWAIKGITRVYFGAGSDIPACGDYDGDQTTDIAIYRGSQGLWAVRGVTRAYFGGSSDIPAPGDYNGDGTCDAAIFRSSTGLWAAKGVTRVYFGGSSDLPIPLYGSGRALGKDIGIFRPSSGLWAIRGLTRIYFGTSSDQPVPGNYTDIPNSVNAGIYRGSSALWALRGVSRIYFGGADDRPVTGNFTGFIPDDIGIFRDSSGLWAILGVTRTYFGTTGDIPVSGLAINPSSAISP